MAAAAPPLSPIRLEVGDRMSDSDVGPLTRTDFVRYAGAGGDFNPIHHDEGFAQEAGMPSVFGMGMLHAGILGSRLAGWVGPANIRSFTVRFTGQVWPDDTLSFSGEVTATQAEQNTADVELAITSQKGVVVLTGTAIVEVAG
jgi:acyl dehydratase